MGDEKTPRIFISYSRQDGEDFATNLRHRLTDASPELTLWQDRDQMEGGKDWWAQIEAALNAVEYMVLVATPEAMASKIVAKEWRYARQQGVCVFPVKVPSAPLDFDSLPRWMRDVHFYDLDKEWDNFVRHLQGACEATRVPFFGVPDLPEGFVLRAGEMDQLMSHLLSADQQNPVAITTALRGAGGFGKTTLAAAICHHEDVATAFDDGILWVTLGEKPDMLAALTKLYAALTDERPVFVDIEEAAARLAERLTEKDCLLVIDDVWQPAHLRPFLRGGERCARLITTRNFDIAVQANAEQVVVDEMTSSESVKMLTARLENKPKDVAPFRKLATRLGEWPLMLELAGAQIRQRVLRGDTPEGALDWVNKALDKRGFTAFDPRSAAERNEAIGRSIEASLDLLTPHEQERCFELAIFPEDTEIPLEVVGSLWQRDGFDEFDTEDLVLRLDGLSLLKYDLQNLTIRLHDVLRAFLGNRLTDAPALHSWMLDVWGDPRALSPDLQYGWTYLAYHMREAGRLGELVDLLADYTWIQAKLDATDPNALLSDYDLTVSSSNSHVLSLIQGAIRLSAHILAEDATQLAPHLLGRLMKLTQFKEIQNLLDQIKAAQTGIWLRPLFPNLSAPGGPLIRTMVGHGDWVDGVALTSDNRALSASWDGTVRVWDVATGETLGILQGHADRVHSVSITPDGRAVSAGRDGTIRLWNLTDYQQVAVYEGHESHVNDALVTEDGLLVSASADTTVRIREVESGKVLHILRGHKGGVNRLALTGDGRVVSASTDCTLRVWDLTTGQCQQILEGHDGSVYATAVNSQGWLFSGADDNSIKIWDLATGTVSQTITAAHTAKVSSLTLIDDYTLVSGSWDRLVKVWYFDPDFTSPTKPSRLSLTLEGHTNRVYGTAADGQGRIISTGADNTVRVWTLAASIEPNMQDTVSTIYDFALTDAGRLIAGTWDGRLHQWDVATGKAHQWNGANHHTAPITGLALHNGRLLSASWDMMFGVWDAETLAPLHSIRGHAGRITDVAVIDEKRAVTCSADGTLRVWDTTTGKELNILGGHTGWVNGVAVLPDGRIVSVSNDSSVRIWRPNKRNALHVFEVQPRQTLNSVAVLDGQTALIGCQDGCVRVMDLTNGQILHVLEGHTDRIMSVAVFDHDHVISTSQDRTVRVWDLLAGECIAYFIDEGVMQTCAMLPDGHTIVAGGATGRVHFLRLEGVK